MIDESFSNSNENNKKDTDHEIIDKTVVDPIDETYQHYQRCRFPNLGFVLQASLQKKSPFFG